MIINHSRKIRAKSELKGCYWISLRITARVGIAKMAISSILAY